jgi:membrane-associated phospholipid phosphatase
MGMLPSRLDIWLAKALGGLIPYHPKFDVGVQDAIRVNILGGLWFGLVLFVLWNQSFRDRQPEVRLRIWTMLFGSGLAILLTILVSGVVSWPPPVHFPGLEELYIGYLGPNPNFNSFPSQSVALYTSVAAGVYSLRRALGIILWMFVVVLISLPRMYVGGHFLTDVVVGFLLALIGYGFVRRFLEAGLIARLQRFVDRSSRYRLLAEILVFVWIIQVTTEFQDVVWLKDLAVSFRR